MSNLFQFRRDSAANWASVNPTLAEGELGLETDTMAYKIGDGVEPWNSLPYYQLSATATNLQLSVQSSHPSAPASGYMHYYSKSVANRALPAFVGPSGLASTLQPLLARNKVGYWCPPGNATTVPGVLGYTALTAVGTPTARTVAVTNMFTRMRRLGFVSAAPAGSLASTRQAIAQYTIGDGSGLGGFFKVIRFGISDAVNPSDARMFVGMRNVVTAPTNVEPSTLVNSVGIGHGAADTNFMIYYGGSAAQTPVDLGANFPCNTNNTDVYDLSLFSPPMSTATIYYEVERINTGHVTTGVLTGTEGVAIPAHTTLLGGHVSYRTNNGTAAAVAYDIMSDYIETDQ